MILEGDLGKQFVDVVKEHQGHTIRIVSYGRPTYENPVNYSIECADCNVVLIDADVDDKD